MRSLALNLNTLALYALGALLAAAFVMQFVLDELPCPLCLLQRAFLCALAAGPILNLRFGPRPSHYALSMLAALAGAAVSARQILLHILPGDPGYGSAILGYHYYTWAFIAFVLALVLLALILLLEGQFDAAAALPQPGTLARAAVVLVIALTAANIVSTLAICGFTACPDNPVRYELFQRQ
ncbi:MAG: disulfide bond formation protein B [Pseudorhodoplanes sp.]|uniref:disulfide bond formation protein B n=1 Tax=Pseudorhodoplanes sp. TaxID=1934341 RepID=UPI003D14556F